jgi:chorismate lyase
MLKLRLPDIVDADLCWEPLEHSQYLPPDAYLSWLTEPGSLTQALIRKSAGEFAVRVHEEQWTSVKDSQLLAQFGPLDCSHRFWSRKVSLLGHGVPWVNAHTLVPEHSFEGPLAKILELNDRPLGEYLFTQADLLRSSLEITAFQGQGWGRRSLFLVGRKPVMVAEFFLPQLILS